MKSYEFLNEAPIDDLMSQQDLDQPPEPGIKPGMVRKAVSAASRAGSNTLGMISKGISQGSSLGGGYGVTGGAIRPAADSPIVSGPTGKIGKDENGQYILLDNDIYVIGEIIDIPKITLR